MHVNGLSLALNAKVGIPRISNRQFLRNYRIYTRNLLFPTML